MRLVWRPVQHDALTAVESAGVSVRIHEVLESWVGTPYMEGQGVRGVATDCVRAVAGVLNDLFGYVRAPLERLPQDVALHAPDTARAALRRFLAIYQPHRRLERGEPVEAGDVLVAGYNGPGHALIAGASQWSLYHATEFAGFHRAGRSAFAPAADGRPLQLFAVYRIGDKHKWASKQPS